MGHLESHHRGHDCSSQKKYHDLYYRSRRREDEGPCEPTCFIYTAEPLAAIRRIMTVSLSGANFAIQTANLDHKKEIFRVI